MIMRTPYSRIATRRADQIKIRENPERRPGKLNDKLLTSYADRRTGIPWPIMIITKSKILVTICTTTHRSSRRVGRNWFRRFWWAKRRAAPQGTAPQAQGEHFVANHAHGGGESLGRMGVEPDRYHGSSHRRAGRATIRQLLGPSDRTNSNPLLSESLSNGETTGGQAVPVLFIAGFGRSGSTLLDRLLGSTPGFHSGGEIAGVWSQGLVEDRLCSCGTRFSRCSFWQAVGNYCFSSLKVHDVDAIVRYLHKVFPAHKMWKLLSRKTRRGLITCAPENFLNLTARLYQGVQDVSSQQVVVDSSKLPTYFVMLAQISSVHVYVVHLVRDPRAVAHSWRRPIVAGPDGRSTMSQFGATKSAILWLIMNVSVEWMARRMNLPYVRVRYEDLVKHPARIVGQLQSEVLRHSGLEVAGDKYLADQDIDLGVVHSICGNPMRFRQGPTPVVGDADWQAGPRGRRAITAAITFPLRWRYGYRTLLWRPGLKAKPDLMHPESRWLRR